MYKLVYVCAFVFFYKELCLLCACVHVYVGWCVFMHKYVFVLDVNVCACVNVLMSVHVCMCKYYF